ncbi:hypothetical protein DUNSADRAFT_18744, partial [Dunaliella salina]
MIVSRSGLIKAGVKQVGAPGHLLGPPRPKSCHAPSSHYHQRGVYQVKLPLLLSCRAGGESSEGASSTPVAAPDATPSEAVEKAASEHEALAEKPEQVYFEGDLGSPAELLISLALASTLIYVPLSMASLGRRLWMNYKLTDKRLIITNTSPLFSRQMQVAYKSIREVRAAPRAFGLWVPSTHGFWLSSRLLQAHRTRIS